MRLGIMQPYFFPYLGHFGLIFNCDQWVVFDITQYTRRSYMTRNEVLKASGGRQRIGADLINGSMNIQTWKARLNNAEKTRKQVIGSLSHYKRCAPHYSRVVELIQSSFDILEMSSQPTSLVQLNISGLRVVCQYLGLPFQYHIASELPLHLEHPMGPGDWAPAIARQLGAKQYLNPIGGKELFKPDQFKSLGIELQFLKYHSMKYHTLKYQFEPDLSILDVLMWNTPDAIIHHLRSSCYIESES